MNLVYADLTEVFSKDGMRMGKIRIGGALRNVPARSTSTRELRRPSAGLRRCRDRASRIREYLGGEICV
jgi:hypothetical protein